MTPEELTKQCTDNGINNTGDGLLRGFIARGLYSAAVDAAKSAIAKREREIEFLRNLRYLLEENK